MVIDIDQVGKRYGIKEVAGLLDLSECFVLKLIKRGQIIACKDEKGWW
jgi:hypothetical protein